MRWNVALLVIIIAAGGPRPTRAAEEMPADFAPARRVLERAIRDHAFPGCAVAVGTSRGPLWKEGIGSFDYDGGPAVTTRSLYDLASLTKVIGTTPVILVLARDRKLSLDERVAKQVPAFAGERREEVTIEHLLTHSSGLPAWRPLFREAKGVDDLLSKVIATALECPPGTRESYSDLGFMLLGEVAARAGGKPLAELERALVFEPLGLTDTTRVLREEDLGRVVPTERMPDGDPGAPEGGPFIRGTVHDENAAAGGGLTGHAGLFSTAEDLSILAEEVLRGYRGESSIFPANLARRFAARRDLVEGSSRALGWDTPSGLSSAGTLLSRSSFGHTGFTGTSLWLDPERNLYILLLSNRVHPTRENTKIAAVRRALADAVVLCFPAPDGRPEPAAGPEERSSVPRGKRRRV